MSKYEPIIASLKEIEDVVKDSQEKWGMREFLESNIATLFSNAIIKVVTNVKNTDYINFDPRMTGLAILHGSMTIMNGIIHNESRKIKSIDDFKEELIAVIMDVQQLGYRVRCNYSEYHVKDPNSGKIEDDAFFDICVGAINLSEVQQDTSTGILASRLGEITRTDHDGILEFLNSSAERIRKQYEESMKSKESE